MPKTATPPAERDDAIDAIAERFIAFAMDVIDDTGASNEEVSAALTRAACLSLLATFDGSDPDAHTLATLGLQGEMAVGANALVQAAFYSTIRSIRADA